MEPDWKKRNRKRKLVRRLMPVGFLFLAVLTFAFIRSMQSSSEIPVKKNPGEYLPVSVTISAFGPGRDVHVGLRTPKNIYTGTYSAEVTFQYRYAGLDRESSEYSIDSHDYVTLYFSDFEHIRRLYRIGSIHTGHVHPDFPDQAVLSLESPQHVNGKSMYVIPAIFLCLAVLSWPGLYRQLENRFNGVV